MIYPYIDDSFVPGPLDMDILNPKSLIQIKYHSLIATSDILIWNIYCTYIYHTFKPKVGKYSMHATHLLRCPRGKKLPPKNPSGLEVEATEMSLALIKSEIQVFHRKNRSTGKIEFLRPFFVGEHSPKLPIPCLVDYPKLTPP